MWHVVLRGCTNCVAGAERLQGAAFPGHSTEAPWPVWGERPAPLGDGTFPHPPQ